jgi:hypothetical protein
MRILASASKITFLALTLTACVAFLWGKLEGKDFMLLCTAAYGYYFAYKGSTPDAPSGGMAGK